MNPNLFSYFVHWTRRINHNKAFELTKGLQSIVFYNKAFYILKNHELKIEWKQFYNLIYAEVIQKLKLDKELTLLLAMLDHKNFRVYVNDIY